LDKIEKVVPVIKENDGCCWIEEGVYYVNLRWADPRDICRYLILCDIHEIVEHIVGAGHDVAVKSEKIIEQELQRRS